KTTCAFFRPHSDEVLFASTHLDPEAGEKQKVELDFRAAGKERRYSWDYDEEAAYSPDGKRIVFTSLRDAYPAEKLSSEDCKRLETDPAYFGEIYIMN